ncbi:hypothetical protein AWC38_SpisGene23689 [Stylophora pistillata]|uniref:DUF5641 domain-containing protein n=1 Tax=Stylophora pistillata TaxID=50429 RepID=A0A2B4R6E2_STYPI|nr:hypothetical protein AWC38_SpisGene23689 [Stylophora pistillata]
MSLPKLERKVRRQSCIIEAEVSQKTSGKWTEECILASEKPPYRITVGLMRQNEPKLSQLKELLQNIPSLKRAADGGLQATYQPNSNVHGNPEESRRGVHKDVTSDRGKNFMGAEGELKKLVRQLDRKHLQNKTVELGVTWRFNPPAAPHFGGAHEIMVKAAKKSTYAVVGERDVNDEELITVFAGVESLLNFRPLTYQSSDPRDDVPLTPNYFLHGQMGGQFAPEAVETTTLHPRQRWRKVQDIISPVWRRWLKEVIPALNSRPKWTSECRDLKVEDVALVI